MPNVRTLLRSFAGGEVSPEMYGRIDDEKYQSGAAIMRNFIAKAQGPVENRAGFKYVSETKSSITKSRLIPFTKSNTDTCVIEIGVGAFRFYSNGSPITIGGGAPYELAHTYTENEIFDIHYVQSYDVITLVHPNHPPRLLSRISASPPSWTLTQVSFVSTISPPVITSLPTGNTDPKYNYSYVVTAVAADGVTQSIASNVSTQYANLNTSGCVITISWTGVQGASRYYVYKLQGGIYGYIGETIHISSSATHSVVDNNIAPDMSVTPPRYESPFASVSNAIESVSVSGGGQSQYGTLRGAISTTTKIATIGYGSAAVPSEYSFSIIDWDGSGSGATATYGVYSVDDGTGHYWNYVQVNIVNRGNNYKTPAIRGVQTKPNGYVNTWYLQNGNLSAYPFDVALRVIDNPTPTGTGSIPGTGSGAVVTPVLSNGTYGSIIGVTVVSPGSNYSNPAIVIDESLSPIPGSHPTFTVTRSTGTDYPGAVSYFEQRKCFAGTSLSPAKVWMTRSGTEANMSYSVPSVDDDRIAFQVAAREANTIRHIVPLNQLILLTGSAEWRVSSVNSDALTPSSISVRPQSYVGANNVQPSVINNSLVYCAARGGHVRECGYNWQSSGFITADLSLRAAHLFDDFNIVDMCHSKAPQPIIWFVSTSGKLLGLTYIPEQSVGAWHQHDTSGEFESCATVAEGDDDVLYVVVKRKTQNLLVGNETFEEKGAYVQPGTYVLEFSGAGSIAVSGVASGTFTAGVNEFTVTTAGNLLFVATGEISEATCFRYVRFVERMQSRYFENLADAYFVDCGKIIDTVTSPEYYDVDMSHLRGSTVSILADGSVLSQVVVPENGIVRVTGGFKKIIIGLPYQSDLKTLPLALQSDSGYAQGRMKNVNKVWLRVYRSSGIFIGPSAELLTEAKQRTTENYGSPPALKSEEVLVNITPTWSDGGSVYVRQLDPLPLTILNMTMEVAMGA